MMKTRDGFLVPAVVSAYASEFVFKCQRHDDEIAQGNALGRVFPFHCP